MPCLHRQDVLFAETLESKTSPNTSDKRVATEALHVAEVEVGGRRNKRKIDNLPPCSHCHKLDHSIDTCWENYPDKKRAYNARGRAPPQSVLPLTNITSAESLQAMLSKAVDDVLSSANKKNCQFGRLCELCPLVILSSTTSTLAPLIPFNSIDKDSQFIPQLCVSVEEI